MSRGQGHWLLFGALLVSTLLTVAVAGFGAGVFLLALLGPSPSLVGALAAVLPYAVGVAVLVVVDLALFVATVVAALRRVSLPRDDRLADIAERAERELPVVRSLGLAERLEPTPEERRRELRRRYVEGDISEAEFERRVGDHVEASDVVPTEDPHLASTLDPETRTETGERDGDSKRGVERRADDETTDAEVE